MHKFIAVSAVLLFTIQTQIVAGEKKSAFDALAPMREHLQQQAQQRAERTQQSRNGQTQSRASVSAPAAQQPAEITNDNRDDGLATLVGLGVTAAVVASGYFYSWLNPTKESEEKK